MYYPMRVVRTRRHKLIHNLTSGLTFPFALDLFQAPTWISVQKAGGAVCGKLSVHALRHRSEFELYDPEQDPDKIVNLAGDPLHADIKRGLIEKLKAFQIATKDPWAHKWTY